MLKNIADILENERSRWFCWFPVLFGLGIGIYFSLPSEPSQWFTLAVVELLLVAAFAVRHYPFLLRIVGVMSIITAGFVDVQLQTLYLEKKLPPPASGDVYIRGQIMSHDTNYRGKPRIVLGNMEDLEGTVIQGKYRLTLLQKVSDIKVGKCVELVAEVAPVMKANLVGGYQPDRRLFYDGINGSGYVLSGVFEIDCPRELNWLVRNIDEWRGVITERISSQLPPKEAAIAAAIVTGNRELMTMQQIENYRDSGLAHFLSISGLHISMIAGLMFFAVRLLMACIPQLGLRYNSKKIAALSALAVSTIYLMISGGAVPTQRAYIMMFMVLTAVWFERQAISMRVLAWAAMIILFFSPQMLINISFQLSFAAVIALVAFYEKFGGRLESFLYGKHLNIVMRIGRGVCAYLLGIVIADLVASMATLPFAIYHFNRIALYTSITNLLSGPIIAFWIMPAILLTLLLLPLGMMSVPLWVAGKGIAVINEITTRVAEMPHSVAEICSFPLWGLLLIVGGGLWLCIWQTKWRNAGWIFILCGCLSLMFVRVPDIIAGDGGKAMARRNEWGKIQVFSGGNKWMKQNWLEKFASANAPQQDNLQAPDLKNIDFDEVIGVSIYGDEVYTVRDYIGRRPWNR